MMTCAQIQERLSAYIDRELQGIEALEVGRHVDGCARCQSDVQALLSVKETLRAQPAPGLPNDLAAAIRGQTLAKPGWITSSFRWFWAPAVVGLAAAAGAWYFMHAQRFLPTPDPVQVAQAPMVVVSTPSARPEPVAYRLDKGLLVNDVQ